MDTEKENQQPEEPDFGSMYDDDYEEDITCWGCGSCGHVESKRPAWGGQCPRCGCIMEEEFL